MSGLELLAPAALIALPALAGIIIVLYLLKLRRRELVVPSVFLWRRAVEDVQANAPFQKLKVNLLLLLQLLALTAVVLGLAAPFVMARRLPGRTAVIVLDASASMSARDVEGCRLDQARQKAAQVARAMTRRDEVALVQCAGRARVVAPLTGDKRRLLSALETLKPTDHPGNMRDGLLLGISLAAKRPHATVYVISDGAFPPLPEIKTSAEVRFITVGERNDNVALLAFEAARPPGSAQHQVFVRLRNYSDAARECVLSIYHEDELIDARKLELGAGQSKVETYAASIGQAGLLKAELEVEDDLASDNVAYTPVTPPAARSILLVSPGNLFLLQALLVLPEVEVFEAQSLSGEQALKAYEEYDVVIFDRIPVPAPPEKGSVMTILAEGWAEMASPGERIEQPAISRWDKQHPALRYVNLSAVEIAQGHALRPGRDAVALAHAGEAPMIVAYEAPDLRGLAFGWNLLDSDLPLRVGFPVLLSNAARWLSEMGRGHELRITRPGETLRFTAPPEAAQAEVILPDGQRRRLVPATGQITFAEVDSVGVYRMTVGEEQWRWAVDLRDPGESDLKPGRELKLGAHRVEAGVSELRAERHFWPYLALLGLLALIAEWHLFHRRY